MFNILLVEDDEKIREIISFYFSNKKEHPMQILEAKDGEECFAMLYEKRVDLVLLDIMLPGQNGFDICKEIRKDNDIPIIFITAKGDEEDVLHGYANGCDDYIVKPFAMAQLYAKVNALLNRAKGMVVNQVMKFGEIVLDIYHKKVFCEGEEIVLANLEFELLRLLMENKKISLSRERIITSIWGYDYEGNERVIDDHIRKLRKSLGVYGKMIKTDINYGYRLSDE